ncbi:zinc-dependent alcohol dehydrogenase family protein [Tunturibacter empetritectus]|uniref:NADPH:quinone reductase-like Zn-dependent oxidoreductase n=1 Tax=Tunturiibacter empetritectus TaxID=3069691 RepID=A0A7W8IKG9_9BACT|nr:zinc-dependent alcohol dehydrogenase family protein [Edaphobacter lichenicola]MBB5318826.1 NADPH:quinone reductase-like Zn-dependent oxidoreductase [Edaphobacter lichenicola]
MPDTVKMVRFHKIGGPEVLQFDDLPLPEPGKGEVRLRVRAIGLNRAESMFFHDRYLETPVLPSTNGYEASGIVEAVGPGVDTSWIGKKASTTPAFSLNHYGVYGEVAIVPIHAVAEYPSKLSYEEGTSIWMQYITAYGALIYYGHLTKGDYVIITAASSSVGLAAIEIAKAEGATSIATTRTSTKKAELLTLGADHVIVTDEEDLVARVNQITANQGARIVFDPIGGKGLEALANATAVQGTIFEYGALAMEPTPYPLFTALNKRLIIQGYTLRDILADPIKSQNARKYVFDNLVAGNFKPRIDKTFPFAQIVEAHRYMESNAQIGKIVVTL